MKIVINLLLASMTITSLFVSAASVNQNAPHFTVLDYFDRNILVSSKISAISETVHIDDKNVVTNEKDYHSCRTYSYRFNRKGSVISETLSRVGTDYGFVYDDNENLQDWTWKNKSSGKIISFKEELKNKPEEFKKELRERKARVEKYVTTSVPFAGKLVRTISDSCFSIEAEYEIAHKKSFNGLPNSAQAEKIRDVGRFLRKGFKSPQKLYISYRYEYFE